MAQVMEEEPHMSKLAVEESFEESSRAVVMIPKEKVFRYKVTNWIPTLEYADIVHPIMLPIKKLVVLTVLNAGKECSDCGKLVIPRLDQDLKFVYPESCYHCLGVVEESVTDLQMPKNVSKVIPQQMSNMQPSSIIQRLDKKLATAFKNYDEHADFRQKSDFTENFTHMNNHAIYFSTTIIQDATEIKVCIDGLIAFDGHDPKYFKMSDKSYSQLYDEVLKFNGIKKLEPLYRLLIIASSITATRREWAVPLMRAPLVKAGSVTNVQEDGKA